MTDDVIRFRLNATTAALVLALLGNGAALVWGAATLANTVDDVQHTVEKLDTTLGRVGSSVQDLRERVGVLEDRGNRTQTPTPLQP